MRLDRCGLALMVALLTVAGCAGSPESSKIAQEYEALEFSVLEDNANKVVSCVEEMTGFVVVAGKDGSVGYESKDVPASQYSLVDEAIPACFEELGFSNGGELTDTQKLRIFALQKEARRCLEGLGYDTPEPPSESTYLESYGGPDDWAPWCFMGEYKLGTELLDVLETCPDPSGLTTS